MSGWDACTMEPNHWLRWIECHPGLAGYVQAAGVVATLAIALFGPPISHWIADIRKRRAARRMTIDFAKMMLSPTNKLMNQAKQRLETLDEAERPEPERWRRFCSDMGIQIPPTLDPSLVAVEEIDTSRLSFLEQLVENTRAYNLKLSHQPQYMSDDTWKALRDELRADLTELNEQALDVTARIRAM